MKMASGSGTLDDAAKKRMAALSELPDEKIDLSDAPEWTAKDFADAVPMRSIMKPLKTLHDELRAFRAAHRDLPLSFDEIQAEVKAVRRG